LKKFLRKCLEEIRGKREEEEGEGDGEKREREREREKKKKYIIKHEDNGRRRTIR